MIAFSCQHCGLKLKVQEKFAGRKTSCPTCKKPLVVPQPDKTPAVVPTGKIDGLDSSLVKAGIDAGVVLGRDGAGPGTANQKTVRELLARREKTGNRYVIESEIARGGMGAVLRAVDCDIRREVAVKYMLNQVDPKKKARFVEEAQITGQLEHPNIVPIHELGIDAQKRLFFSMKMVKGRSLAQVLDALRLDPKTAEKEYSLSRLLNIFVNVCNALAYAHSREVVHRDLKPANIMLGDFGEVYVMDWGLAKVLGTDSSGTRESPGGAPGVRSQESGVRSQESGARSPVSRDAESSERSAGVRSQGSDAPASGASGPQSGTKVMTNREVDADLTQEGAVLGTPVYMPPEQATGLLGAIDQRSDVYSLGAILYEMLALQPPVEKEGGYLSILMRVGQGDIKPPELRVPERAGKIPKELSAVALKALAKNKEDRYPSAEALRSDIERFLEGRSVSAKEDSAWEMFWKLLKRNKGASATTLAMLLVLVLVVGFFVRLNYRERVRAQAAYAELVDERKAKQEQGKKSAPLFVQDARQTIRRLQFDYALAQANVALDYDPDLDEARLLKGQLLLVHKQYAPARAELLAYLERQPDDKDAAALARLCQEARADRTDTLAPLVEVLIRQREFTLAEEVQRSIGELEKSFAKLVQLYRQRLDAAWQGAGKNLTVDKEGKLSFTFMGLRQIKDLVPLQGLPLSHLKVSPEIRDLSPILGMKLTSLGLAGCGEIRDLTPLQGMPLTTLDLGGCQQVPDLTLLRGLPLVSLRLDGCRQIRDLTPLQSLPLTSLRFDDCRQVKDLTPLQGLPLTALTLSNGVEIRDLAPLRGLKLASLDLGNCRQVPDLAPLRGMPLTTLILGNCVLVQDLAPLKGMPLTRLDLTGCSQVQELAPLRGLKLVSLNLGNCGQVKDLTPLQNMPITVLNLSGCGQVRELASLKGMPLTALRLDNCGQLDNLAPLRGLPLTQLTLNNCGQVKDLTPLKDMKLSSLSIANCGQVKDLTPLEGMSLIEVHFTLQNITKGLEVLRRMKSLKYIGFAGNHKWPTEEFWRKHDTGEFKKMAK